MCDHRHAGRPRTRRYHDCRGRTRFGPSRPAGKPEREPGHSRAVRRPTRTRRCRRPHRAHGPPSRETNPQRPRPETDAAVETRCCPWRPSRTSATRSSACRPSRAGACAGICSRSRRQTHAVDVGARTSRRAPRVSPLGFAVRRIAYSAGVPSGAQPGHAPAFGPAASPGGRECRRHPGMTLTSPGTLEVQR